MLNVIIILNLFDGEIIEKWAESYISILEKVVKDPGYPIDRIPLNNDKNAGLPKTRLSAEINEDIKQTYAEAFKESVHNFPDNIAIKYKDKSLTYIELNERSDKICRYLGSIGVNTGSIVGIYLDRSDVIS